MTVDLAIRIGPLAIGAGLVARRIACNRSILCAAASYVERCGSPQTLDDLARHDVIVYCRDGRNQIRQFVGTDGVPQGLMQRARLRLNDLGAMLDAVLDGRGIAWLPEWLMTAHLGAGKLIELLPENGSELEDIHIIWPAAPHLPTRVRAAIDALSDSISKAKWSVECHSGQT